MATVRRREDESVEQLIKRFKKAVMKDNVLGDYRNHLEYKSKSIKKKEKIAKNAKKRLKALKKAEKNY